MIKGYVLVTGGCGYIGSHTVVKLIENGFRVVVIDNLSNGSKLVLDRIAKITGSYPEFLEGDVRDKKILEKVFVNYKIDCVIHFAGLKSVAESVEDPLAYYDNNVAGCVTLLIAMSNAKVKNFIFSSSATVYGTAKSMPVSEQYAIGAINPYGKSKQTVEMMLNDLYRSDDKWRIAALRYFNPIGAHVSGLIGECPSGPPNNLLPIVAEAALGMRRNVLVFGGDYNTKDGTAIRDYVHVEDLAEGHLAAMNSLNRNGDFVVANLGTGQGTSVLEIIKKFEKVSGKNIEFEIAPRRVGDVEICYSDPSLAFKKFGWVAKHNIERMCADTWRWLKNNPNGYDENG